MSTKDSLSIAVKRLTKELEEIITEPPTNCSAGPKNDSNIFEWVSTIVGPEDSPYAGGVFVLDIKFSETYPYSPPLIKFRTPIYHCNISKKGDICLDILKQSNWSAVLTVSKLLLSISSLLTDCNPDDPLEATIAFQYRKERKEHDRTAREWTRKFASLDEPTL